MTWFNSPIRSIAPPLPAASNFATDQEVWHLSLDQIEGDTGELSGKRYAPASEAGTSTFCFDTGNVLYSKLRPYLNKVIVPDEPGIATTELIPLRPNPAILDQRFLAYYLRSSTFMNQASHHVAGAKMPRVVMDWFWEYEFPLPTPKEQGRIVELLEEADWLRRLSRKASTKSERILPALFLTMFGDTENNPKGLCKKPLGEIIHVKSGDFLPAKDMAADGQYPVYGGNGISGYHDRFMFGDRRIVLGRVGAYCGVVHYSQPNAWVTDNALYISEKLVQIHDVYLAVALKLANLNQYAGRAGQPLISGSRIYPVEVLLPPMDHQLAFAQRVEGLTTLDGDLAKASERLNHLWDVMLGKAFSGQLTAKWREAHMKELLAEMEVQARQLNLPMPQEAAV